MTNTPAAPHRIINSLLCIALLCGLCFAGMASADANRTRQVLVFSKTAEYRHQSIPAGIAAIKKIGDEDNFSVVASEDASLFNDASLAAFQAVIFLNTTGDILDEEQQVAMERYIQAGGGFVGIHAAADTEWKRVPGGSYWPWYQRLVGGVFDGHPPSSDQSGKLTVRDNQHPATRSLPPVFQISDEWYDYKRMSAGIHVLLTVDEGSYKGATMGAGKEHPVAWYRDFDGGRSFYTTLGHGDATYSNENFLKLLRGGLAYAMGDGKPLDYSKSRPEDWRFKRTVLDSDLNEPLKLAFSPEGKLYYVERRGNLQRYDFERGTSLTVHTFSDVNSFYEYGLLSLAFDPDFKNNHWIYLYRTIAKGAAGEHVLARFKLRGDELDEKSEQVLLSMPADARPEHEASHTGGDMKFDSDGNLWLSTGDDTRAGDASYIDDRPGNIQLDAGRSAGNTQDLRGKILRIKPRPDANASGLYYDIPQGNLFASASDGRPEIYVMGVRNPYTISVDSRRHRLYWGDVGPDARAPDARGPVGYDEINIADKPGNYGWPYVIADNQPYAYYDYDQQKALDKADVNAPQNRSRNNTGLKVLPPAQPAWIAYPYAESDKWFELLSGGRNALVAPIYYSDQVDSNSQIKFPAYFDGKLIISDFIRRWLMVVNTDAQGRPETIVPIIDAPLSAPLDLAFGPDGALYIVEYGSNWFSANIDSYLSRIEYYSGDDRPPIAIASAQKSEGAAPLHTMLDASQSFDPDGAKEKLKYLWQRMENGKAKAVIGEQQVQPVTLEQAGEQFVQLTVTDDGGQSSTTSLRFQVGNEPPTVSITTPNNRSFFWADQPFKYQIEVTDKEDGSTASGSIAPHDVAIRFGYVAGGEDLEKALAAETINPVLAGRDIVASGSDCHACHDVENESIGPSFTQVAQRYASTKEGAATIRQSIQKGVSGKWGGTHAMPVHADLSDEQLDHIVAFILSLATPSQAPAADLQLAGTLRFNLHQRDASAAKLHDSMSLDLGTFYPGAYYLSAHYTDRGGAQAPALQAHETLLLRSPILLPNAFDKVEGLQLVNVGRGLAVAIVNVPTADRSFNYGMLKGIDLTGIRHIKVVAAAMQPAMSGGVLELRVDNEDSAAIASRQVEASTGVQIETTALTVDVSQLQDIHDLYIGAPARPGSAASGVQYYILSIEFLRD
jgi:cytochrome c